MMLNFAESAESAESAAVDGCNGKAELVLSRKSETLYSWSS